MCRIFEVRFVDALGDGVGYAVETFALEGLLQ